MKKLLIGCGILLVLAVAGIGFVVWKLMPGFREISAQWQAATATFERLDEEHPFTALPLDERRFEESLQLRENLLSYMERLEQDIEAQARKDEEADTGMLAGITNQMRLFAPMLPGFAAELEALDCGPTELAHHTRVLWATLRRARDGTGGPELHPLREAWPQLERDYAELVRRDKRIPSLDQIVGQLDLETLQTAERVLASNVPRVLGTLHAPFLEPLFLRMDQLDDPDAMEQVLNGWAVPIERMAEEEAARAEAEAAQAEAAPEEP